MSNDQAKSKQDWINLKEKNVVRALAMNHPYFVREARGAEIFDLEGKRLIDFTGGIAVMNVGHSHPKVVKAVQEQLANFQHSCFPIVPYTSYIRLAEKLNNLVPGKFAKKTFLVNSGAEAVENAIKIAKHYTKRKIVLAFTGAFHGRTHYTLALTGKVNPYKAGFFAYAQDVYHLPFPNDLYKINLDDTKKAMDALFRNDCDKSDVAAIIVEPVQGEGGYIPAKKELLSFLRKFTQEHGIVLIIDEVQSGFGRCGKYFAIENYIAEAGDEIGGDLYVYAKSFAAGLPLSGVTGKAEIMDSPSLAALGSTYGGNPSAVAAALAVIDVLQEEKLLERSMVLGKKLMTHLKGLQPLYPNLKDIRGLGSMVAAEFFVGDSPEQGADLVKKIIQNAQQKGLLLLSCGLYSNTLRFMYPLVISDAIFDEALAILTKVLQEELTE